MSKEESPTPKSKDLAVNNLAAIGLQISRFQYGRDGIEYLAYHNELHAKDVISAVNRIGILAVERGKIDRRVLGLLKIAASFHDVVQLRGPGINERLSANRATFLMQSSGVFPEQDIERVRGFILATEVFPLDGTIAQAGTDDYLTQVMCDADLSLLGDEREKYWQRSTDLLRELKRGGNITVEDFRRFLESQQRLLKAHRFFTPEALEIFPRQQEHLGETTRILENPTELSRAFARMGKL